MLKYLCALTILLLAGGCATAMRGNEQKVTIVTDPPGATVRVVDPSANHTMTTPATLTLKRKQAYEVIISKEGYAPIVFIYQGVWDGATMGNVIMPGGSLGAGMDLASGADLSFNELRTIKLTPATGPTTMPTSMKEYRGKIVTPEEYERLLRAERNDKHRFTGDAN